MTGRLDPAVADVRRAVRQSLSDLPPGSRVVVACSGGADSLALAAATVFEGSRSGLLVGAVVVDHGLQDGSAGVARTVGDQLRQLGCDPVEVVTAQVKPGGGPEAAARRARYTALSEVAEQHSAVVLLGHTRDDQAETVLLGLTRGSGLRSMSGMAPRTDRYRRPLLDIPGQRTHQACRALGLQVWDDPHNVDPRFLRVRVRSVVLPMLEAELGPGVADALARTATMARADADALDSVAEELAARARRGPVEWDVGLVAAALPALRRRVLRLAALAAGCPAGELFAVHVDAIERLVTDWHGQLGVDLPGGVRASRHSGALRFEPASPV